MNRRTFHHRILALLGSGSALVAASGCDGSGPQNRGARQEETSLTPTAGDALVLELNAKNWQKEVAESAQPVVVDFWAPWCGPCRQQAPIIEQIAKKFVGKVKVGKLNTDDNPALAARYGIDAIPQVFIFKGGDQKPVKQVVGLTSEAELVKLVTACWECEGDHRRRPRRLRRAIVAAAVNRIASGRSSPGLPRPTCRPRSSTRWCIDDGCGRTGPVRLPGVYAHCWSW